MKGYAENVAALGKSILVRTISSDSDPPALVARWKHGDALFETSCADALRIVLSLNSGYSVRDVQGSQPAVKVLGGSVAVIAPHRHSRLQIEGSADIVVVFIAPESLDDAAGFCISCEPSLDVHDAELQAATLRLFLSARGGDPDDDLLMQTSLWRVIEHLVGRHTPNRLKRPRGRMPIRGMRRVEELISDRLACGNPRAPSIDDLAQAAGMSVCHFIRTFRQTTGATPHQYVLTRRIERAMGLLAQPGCSVAEVADSTGYASPSHFVASFRQRLGMTPASYRQAVLA